MGRRAALIALVLVIVLVVAGTVALSNGRDTLDRQRSVAQARWKPLRAPLTQRYGALAALVNAARPLRNPPLPVFAQVDTAEARWTGLQKQPFKGDRVPAEVTAANNLEGLIGRVSAAVPDSPRLNGNPAVQAALTGLKAAVPPPALVTSFDDAVTRYNDSRNSFWDRVPAELFGYDAIPSFAMVATG
ncbi:MAG: hypothetical protein JWL73_3548 [Actinomycetia bacterium]|nr:hypothetical protein [Actinomycetes bacterium]